MEKLQKKLSGQPEPSCIPDSEELELINRHTIKPLGADEVFCFTVKLCDNEIDRDFEKFSVEALTAMAPMFVGKTGITDHSMKSDSQHSRIYKTWIEESDTEKTSLGENYTCLKARAYIPLTAKTDDIITQIKAGIKKETSISCSMAKSVCSVCGSDTRKSGCKHRKGEIYDGKVCHSIFYEPTDVYEFSFVAVPAQPRAGVTKSFCANDGMSLSQIEKACTDYDSVTLSLAAFTSLTSKMRQLEALSKDAELYRKALEKNVIRLGAMAMPELGSADFEQICKTLTAGQLAVLEKAFESNAAKQFPLAPQLCPTPDRKTTDNNEFKI